MDIESKITRFLTEKFRPRVKGELAPDLSLFDSGILDSVGIFDLVGYIEEEFGMKVPDEQIVPENFGSVDAISAFVKRERGAA